MNELDMCKAFAGLEGVYDAITEAITKQQIALNSFISSPASGVSSPTVQTFESIYNPITDQCLTFQAAIDYGVNLSHETCDVWISDENAGEYDSGFLALVKFEEGGIPKAIIECILKSEGLYE